VTVPKGVTFVHLVAGGANSLALDSHGNVWAWGNGLQGEIGNSTDTNSPQPVTVDRDVSLISATANNVLDYHASG
jgi:alpha-tubulin suppressor-like RCC1 family protein